LKERERDKKKGVVQGPCANAMKEKTSISSIEDRKQLSLSNANMDGIDGVVVGE